MKYVNKEQVIEKAQRAGSRAKSLKGAMKFLVKIKPTVPLEKRCTNKGGMSRATTRTDYKNNLRGNKILKALNLMDYEEACSFAHTFTAQLLDVAEDAIFDVYSEGYYRYSKSSCVGGYHIVNCAIDEMPSAKGYSTKVSSGKFTWSGTNSHIDIVTKWQTLCMFPTLTLPGSNYILIGAEKTEQNEIIKVTVLEQGRGFSVKPVEIWYVKSKRLFKTQKQAMRELVRA